LLVSASDLTRIGVAEGDEVKVTSSQTSLTLPVRVDPRLVAGVARLAFAPGARGAADLIDSSEMVTDVRVETLR
jgi:anaerobic selenocysteine-containing dehydrogenase